MMLLLSLAGCGPQEQSTPAGTVTLDAVPGAVVGTLQTEDGRPLEQVTIRIEGRLPGSTSSQTKTQLVAGPAPRYAVELFLQAPEARYAVTATLRKAFEGQSYLCPLTPLDGRSPEDMQPGKDGIVKDFRWNLTGPRPGKSDAMLQGEPEAFLGASILLSMRRDQMDKQRDGEVVVFTLTPQGPLIDGSTGRTLEMENNFAWSTKADRYLMDIPLGRYRVTAVIVEASGQHRTPIRLHLPAAGDPPLPAGEEAVDLVFPGAPADASPDDHPQASLMLVR